MLLKYMKVYVSMDFLHLLLTFSPKNDVMVNRQLVLRRAFRSITRTYTNKVQRMCFFPRVREKDRG